MHSMQKQSIQKKRSDIQVAGMMCENEMQKNVKQALQLY